VLKYIYDKYTVSLVMSYRPANEWGPFVWGLIHTISLLDFEDPDAQRRALEYTIEALKGIPSVIPCHRCAAHYQLYVLPELAVEKWIEPMSLFRFMVDYHNTVNRKLNKPQFTYEDALIRWGKHV